jgi:peroxiredoxin
MNASTFLINVPRIFALVAVAATIAAAFDQPSVRATLLSEKDRKPAPAFALEDASGKTAELSNYQGKILVLDFWATWCTGCKQEIPWFSQFEKEYGKKGLAVVGVSMDDKGWTVVKPFLAKTHVPYRMVLGNDAMAQQYGIENMPDTFLIDRQGRVAAAYRAGLVDRENIEANIKALLAER